MIEHFPAIFLKTVAIVVAISGWVLSWGVITRTSICELVKLQISKFCEGSIRTHASPLYDHMASHMWQSCRYNQKPLSSFCFTFEAWSLNFCSSSEFFPFQTSLWDFNLGSKLHIQVSLILIICCKNAIPSFSYESNVFYTVPYNVVFVQETSCTVLTVAIISFIRYLVKMRYIVVFDISDDSSTPHTVIPLSSSSNVDIITVKVLSIMARGNCYAHSSVDLLPSWNHLNH